jgi:hypothetical protein
MPKFSIRDLLWSVTFMGPAAGIYAYGLLHGADSGWVRPELLGFVSPLIGVGTGALYQRKFIGFALGLAAMVALIGVFGIVLRPDCVIRASAS